MYITNAPKKARGFVPNMPLLPCLMLIFVGKSKAYPSEAYVRCSTWVGFSLAHMQAGKTCQRQTL